MTTENKREIALEQAAVALLSEIAKSGVDLQGFVTKAQTGIMGNAMYTWLSDHELKTESCSAVSYLVQRGYDGAV